MPQEWQQIYQQSTVKLEGWLRIDLFRNEGEPTNITPDGCPIDNIIMPNNGICGVNKTGNKGPDHIETCAGIPCLQVPWQRDDDEDGTEQGEQRKSRETPVRPHRGERDQKPKEQ